MQTRPKKYNYESKKFLDLIGSLAGKGWSDKDIALDLNLTPQYFNGLKNEKIEETDELTPRAKGISEALMRAREKLNLIARDVYFKTAIGQKKVKEVARRYAEYKCVCHGHDMDCPHCFGTGKVVSKEKQVIEEIERELPPNAQALSVWLFNHDEEWKKNVIESKRLDITSGGKEIAQRELVFLPSDKLTPEQIEKYMNKINGTESGDNDGGTQ